MEMGELLFAPTIIFLCALGVLCGELTFLEIVLQVKI
jgi:hypothetical protein